MSPAPESIGAMNVRAFRSHLLGTVSLYALVVGTPPQNLQPTFSMWMHPDTGELSAEPIWGMDDGCLCHL